MRIIRSSATLAPTATEDIGEDYELVEVTDDKPLFDLSQVEHRAPHFRNWSGNVKSTPIDYLLPKDEQQLADVVRYATANGRKVRIVGSGHSFTSIAAGTDILVSLDKMASTQLKDVNLATSEVTVNAGARIHDLGEPLWNAGLSFPNQGDIDEQTVGGALGTGTHGTGVNFGSMSTRITGMRILSASGRYINCSATENPDIFNAARVSMGTLGIVTEVRLKLQPAFNLHLQRTAMPIADALAQLDTLKTAHRNFELFWNPGSDQAQVQVLDETKEAPKHSRLKEWFGETVIGNFGLGTIIKLSKALPFLRDALTGLAKGGDGNADAIDHAYKIFPHKRSVRFEEMEYAVPAAAGERVLRDIGEFVRKHDLDLFFPVEFRYTAADDIPLSPFYGRASATVSVHMDMAAKDDERQFYFDGVEAILRKYGGRPHWGKEHSLSAAELAPLYPQWAAFQAARDRMDPTRTFSSPSMERLLGP